MKTPTRIIIPLILVCVAIASEARATCHEGCGGAGTNTFLGEDALINDEGTFNTAVGSFALHNIDSTATGVTAVGAQALASATSGLNTAVGSFALTYNTTGSGNNAFGDIALAYNTTGNGNTAVGSAALLSNTTGYGNTAIGGNTLSSNRTGGSNIALGAGAGAALTTGSNNIDIGNGGVAGESSRIRIGTEGTHTATYIAGIRQAALAHGTALAIGITADGQLGVRASSARFKEAIKPMDKASEAILGLKPVSFRYKKELDPKGALQFGLVAEEVAKVNPDLVVADDHGKPFTVRYEEVNAMLLNEFLKAHSKIEEQAKTAEEQASKIERLEAALKNMSARLDAKGL